MNIWRKSININTKERVEFIDITSKVENFVNSLDIDTGLVNIFNRHSTAGLLINENEKGLINDFKKLLERIVPVDGNYEHNRIDNNADSHQRSVLLDSSKTLQVVNGKLDLGTWQRIFFVELDGPRTRTVNIMVVGE
ncbi:protein of unknown function UPF0047 [Methanothermus fervidus DSM 2088]|uniref:Secondary thiamine-phosphate synthase enzyme n=1 Tax=Methanothermus fervidus (strain ATCC 43054 / DSM 2088 / JCM 10308 / V24 S) TaxID=523846 RepID=E3GXZ3_METFV|nr:secondary thiamine-phosphate synthase enzyme YjbQ [Methanothermus fervidus]ADP77175.1 protein of unknown function UPF0047 [Methanothermus fervidus DSM 2088]